LNGAAEPVEPRDVEGELEDVPASGGRFQNWRAFLFVAISVNGLYLWGMLAQMGDAHIDAWTKALAWLPFNVIATVLYFVFLVKLAQGRAGLLFKGLCLAMIVLNWTAFFAA
jgi:hypothetical protein